MRIQPRSVSGFLSNPNRDCRAVLIYGPDAGLARERVKLLMDSKGVPFGDPFQHDAFAADQILGNQALFFDAAGAQSMIGGDRAVTISGAGDRLTAILKPYLDAPNPDCLVLVAAGELSRGRSSLVKLFEGHEAAAAIACYEDTPQDRETVLLEALKGRNIRIADDALDWAVSALNTDRAVARSEAEKLSLYGQAGDTLTLSDVQSALGLQGDVALDDIAFAIASGAIHVVDRDLERAEIEGVSGVAVMRVLISHFLRLLSLRRRIDAGTDADAWR